MSTDPHPHAPPTEPTEPAPPAAGLPTSRRRWWLLGLGVVGLVVIWGVLAAAQLIGAAARVRDAREGVRTLRDVRPEDLLEGDLVERLVDIGDDLDAAADRTGSAVVAPLKLLPVVGRQVRSADAMASAGAEALDVITVALTDARRMLDTPLAGGAERVAVLRGLHEVVARADAALAATDLGPREALVGPLHDARQTLDEELGRVRELLQQASAGTLGLADLLEGPHRFLLLAANNAEMRAGMGFFGSAGVLETRDGRLSVTKVETTSTLLLPDGAVPAPADLEGRWGWLKPTTDMRNLALTPRFTEVAPLAARMWEAAGHDPVDGVLAVDPGFLAAALSVTGPVELEGEVFDADSIVDFLLNGQYRDVLDFDEGSRYVVRKDHLSRVTAAVLATVDQRDLDVVATVDAMRDAAQARHILAWSSVPEQQAAFEAAGIDGELQPDSLLLSLVNRSGNKLDWYLNTGAVLSMEERGGDTEVTVDVRIRNEARLDDSPYVIGPNPRVEPPLEKARYRGILAVSLPGAARDVRLEGAELLQTSGPDGPSWVAMAMVEIPHQELVHYRLRFTLPGAGASVRVEPTGRLPAVRWTIDGHVVTDGRAHTVRTPGSASASA